MREATKWNYNGFYQIIKNSHFPICKPYGTQTDDKSTDFGTKFWAKFFNANKANADKLDEQNLRQRSTKLKDNYAEGENITNDAWNALITKIRQEFYIREECPETRTFIPEVEKVTGSDNGQFFNKNDVVQQKDYLHMYNDVLTLLLYEVSSSTGVNNDRLPRTKFSANFDADTKTADLLNTVENPNATPINEGSHYDDGNCWFTGGTMREYRYRYAKGDAYVTKPATHGLIAPISAPSDIMTNSNYGYAPRGEVKIQDTGINKSFVSKLTPYGNIDYIKRDSNGNLMLKQDNGKVDTSAYEVSQEYLDMVEARKKFLTDKKMDVEVSRQKVAGTDEYGNTQYITETKTIKLNLLDAITKASVTYGGDKWTVNIKAQSVNNYFMKLLNKLSSTCVCNCNYCSCFGHEASCICYVVKVTGWCYHYLYN